MSINQTIDKLKNIYKSEDKIELSYIDMLHIVYTLHTEDLSDKHISQKNEMINIFIEDIKKELKTNTYFPYEGDNSKVIDFILKEDSIKSICLEKIFENASYKEEEENLKEQMEGFLRKLLYLSKTETIQTKKLFKYAFSSEYKYKKKFIKEQLGDTGKILFLGIFQVIPFSGLITPALIKVFDKMGVNLLPSAFEDMEKFQNKIIDWIDKSQKEEAEKKGLLVEDKRKSIFQKMQLFKLETTKKIKTRLKGQKMEYNISIDNKNETSVWIDSTSIKIDESIEDNEKFEYKVRTRAEIISFLEETLPNTKDLNNITQMEEELEYLNSIIDVFVFTGVSSNDIIASSDNPKKFDSLCVELLNLNDKVKKEKRTKKSNNNSKSLSQ